MTRRFGFGPVLILLVGLALGCGKDAGEGKPGDGDAGAEQGGLTKVRLQLNWFPEAEHGGFYAALVEGYYEDAGLDVEIIKGAPGAPVIQQVARGAIEFGVVNADVLLLGRAQEAGVAAVMAPIQTSPRCLMVHAESGIERFEDLHDMTLAMNDTQAFVPFLRKKLTLEGVRIVPYQGSVAQFMVDPNLGQQAYVFSEPFLAEQQGAKTKTLLVASLGFDPYTSLLIVGDEYLRDQAEVVRKMTEASARGWERYLAEPILANELIHSLNSEMSMEALAYGAEALRKLNAQAADPAPAIGHMSRDRWRTLAEQMVEIELLKSPDVAEGAFTTEFLPPRTD